MRRSLVQAVVPLTLALLVVPGCDWDQRGLLDSIPLTVDVDAHPSLHVFLGVDGVSREALDQAREQGAFADFSVSTLVPMFPATSDASWTRILRAPVIDGYEYTSFSASKDAVVHEGLDGLVGHALPPTHDDQNFPYYRAFQFHGAGYVDALEDYADPVAAFKRGLEDLFSVLGGRVGRADVVTAYLVEPDVAAHGLGREAMVQMLLALSARIANFEARHREVAITFTLVSDHGSDHTFKTIEVVPQGLAARVGIHLAPSLAAAARSMGPSAVAVEHTRTTYGVMHTNEGQAEAIAALVSRDEVIDVVVAQAQVPENAPAATGWTALYRGGLRIARFGYDETSATYWLEREGAWASLGLSLDAGEQPWVAISDVAQFEATIAGPYPDLLFRSRSSLEARGIRTPAQVLYSLKENAVMRGIPVPGAASLGSSGSHGALGGGGSRGVLLSQHRELAPNVRSDDLLDFFPDVQAFVSERFKH